MRMSARMSEGVSRAENGAKRNGGAEATAEKSSVVGNAAAMREALLEIVEIANAWADPGADAATTLGLIIDRAEDALAVPPRNVAAMREALEKIRKIASINIYECVGDYSDVRVIEIVDAALAAPARNCDRFTSIERARKAYCSECGRIVSIWDGYESRLFEDWLLAHAEKGGEE